MDIRSKFLLITVLFLGFFGQASATTNSFDSWTFATLNTKKGHWLTHSMFNPRLNNNWRRFDRFFIRNGIGYEIKPGFSLMLGHDYFLINQIDNDIDDEQRIWQQLQVLNDLGDFHFLNRLRLEERFLEREFIASLRWLLQVSHPFISSQQLDWVLSNELFVDLTKNFNYAETRMFAGLNKTFTENFDLSFGYQLRHINSEIDVLSHALLINFNFDLDI